MDVGGFSKWFQAVYGHVIIINVVHLFFILDPFDFISNFHFIFSQLVLIEWADRKTREHAFYFLFENFKKFYLPHIFQDFNPSRALYDSSPGK